MLSEHNWVLSVGTFLPLVGVIIMLFLPKADEALTKAVGIITAAATLAVGVFTLIQFDYGHAYEGHRSTWHRTALPRGVRGVVRSHGHFAPPFAARCRGRRRKMCLVP